MLLERCLAGLLLLASLGSELVARKSKEKLLVSLKGKWRGKCKDVANVAYKRGRHIDDGCYRYSCVRKKRYVVWSRSDLVSACCFIGPSGYQADNIISNTTDEGGCMEKIQICKVEGGKPVIETSFIPLCCLFMGEKYPVGSSIEADMCAKMRCEMTEVGPDIIFEREEATTSEHSTSTSESSEGSTESTASETTMTTTKKETSNTTKSTTAQTIANTTTKTKTTTTTLKTTTTILNTGFSETTSMVQDCFTEKGEKCIFPFISDSNEKAGWCLPWEGRYWWCATAVDGKGKYTKWGKCQDHCPLGPPPTSQMATAASTTTATPITTTTSTASTTNVPTSTASSSLVPSTIASECVTDKGKCVFPFIDDSDQKVDWCVSWMSKYWWCATAVDANGKFTKWGTCPDNCPQGPPTTKLTSKATTTTLISTTTSTASTTIKETMTTDEVQISGMLENQAYFLLHASTGLALEFQDGVVGLAPYREDGDTEKWSLHANTLVNMYYNRSLGIQNGTFSLVDQDSALEIDYANGELVEKTSQKKIAWVDNKLELRAGRRRRQGQDTPSWTVKKTTPPKKESFSKWDFIQCLINRLGTNWSGVWPDTDDCAEKEMEEMYEEMKDANCKGCDKYFHCKANYNAKTKCGESGIATMIAIADCREFAQGNDPTAPSGDGAEDQAANHLGQSGGNCEETYLCRQPPSCAVSSLACAWSVSKKTCSKDNCQDGYKTALPDSYGENCPCSSEPSETCAAEGGYCGHPDSCPDGNVVDNKCPDGNDNKCCLSIPYQEPDCEAEGGQCGDSCGCSGEMLNGKCPSQPESIKCCKEEEESTTAGGEGCEPSATTVAATTPLSCPGGYNTNCINGECTVTCSGGGGGNNNVNNNGGGAGSSGGSGSSGGAGSTGGGGGGEPPVCTGGYNSNCNNGVCTVTCSGGGNNNVNINNNGRKRRRRKRSTGELCEGGGAGGVNHIKEEACMDYKDCISCSASLYCHWADEKCEEDSEQKVPCDACAVCDQWNTNEMKDLSTQNWLAEVNSMFPCPCTILSIDDEFQLPSNWSTDPSCPLVSSASSLLLGAINGNGCEEYHPGAIGCIRSEGRTPSGAGQQCCYDKEGQVLDPDGANGPGAGTPDRVWAGGFQILDPLSTKHKAFDVYPYHWCCKQCKDDDARCKKYYQGPRKLDITHCK